LRGVGGREKTPEGTLMLFFFFHFFCGERGGGGGGGGGKPKNARVGTSNIISGGDLKSVILGGKKRKGEGV